MDREMLIGYLKSRRIHILLAGVACFAAYYIWKNRNYPGEEYYLYGYAKFLIFSNAFYLCLFSRIKFYQSIKAPAIIRMGKQNWIHTVRRIEGIIAVTYFLSIFGVLPLFQGIVNWRNYRIAFFLWALVWIFSYFILIHFLKTEQKELYGILISYVIIIIYCFYLFPLICSAIG